MVLTYHEIAPEDSGYVYSLRVDHFFEHLSLRHTLPTTVMSPQITFDDGHISQYKYALPALQQEAVTGTFFITAAWVNREQEFMNWRHLRELVSLGHQVQSHGWSHALLSHCSHRKIRDELRRSCHSLEDGLGTRIDAISMPGGRWNQAVLAACAEEEYQTVYISNPYFKSRRIEGVMVVGRAMARSGMRASQVLSLLKSEGTIWSKERLRFHLKDLVRSGVGERAYHRLWLQLGGASNRAHPAQPRSKASG